MIDSKIYEALLYLLKNKKTINISTVARHAQIDRASIYYRLNKLGKD